MRKYGRQDSNHGEIRSAFERMGCSVADLSALGNGCPDILVGFGGLCILVEIKNPKQSPSKRRLKPDQERFKMNWTGGYRLVMDLDGVEETVKVLQGWHAAIRTAQVGR